MFRRSWRNFDFWLFGTVMILCIFGIIMIQSAIAGNIILSSYVSRQIIYVAIGLSFVIILAVIDYKYWLALTRLMYIFTFGFLVIIFVIGAARFGSARWLDTGLFLIQPSEIAKIVMIIVLADYFARTEEEPHDLSWIAKSFLLTAGIVIWVILQPNLSTSIVIMVIWFSMLWIGGLPIKYIAIFVLVAILGAIIAFPLLQGYQQDRIQSFIFPEQNAQYGNTYNVDQALVTIGSGGMFGQGYGHGTQVQLRFLKVRHTDFIFSVMAEEFGFIGVLIVIGLLIFVIYRCFRTANRASDRFGSLIAYGFGILIFFQTAVNIGVNLNLIPVTGLTLPFISYGGSSLVSLVLGIGLVESVAVRQKI